MYRILILLKAIFLAFVPLIHACAYTGKWDVNRYCVPLGRFKIQHLFANWGNNGSCSVTWFARFGNFLFDAAYCVWDESLLLYTRISWQNIIVIMLHPESKNWSWLLVRSYRWHLFWFWVLKFQMHEDYMDW